MTNHKTQVAQVLLGSWDPIGVRDVPQAQDEYGIYVHPLAAMLRVGASASEIAEHLLHIETVRMGLRGDAARAHSVAKKLRTLRGL